MKQFVVILLIAIVSCKSEPKTENGIDNSVYKIWNNYTTSNPEFTASELPESWFFHNNKRDANRLARLVVNGNKKASSGLYAWYKEANAPLPKIGTHHIITNFEGKAQAIIQIRKVDTIPFKKIPKAYAALDMGTLEQPLEKWQKAHRDFFITTLTESGDVFNEDMLVVCEWFETVWTKK